MSLKNDIAHIFGHFFDAYIQRWHEQGLTGNLRLTVNFYKGGVTSGKFEDTETKTTEALKESKRFSTT